MWYGYDAFLTKSHEQRFESQTSAVEESIERRLMKYETVLIGGKGLFAASKEVEYDEWHEFVQSQEIQKRFPGIQGMGFSKHIGGQNDVLQLEEKIRNERYSAFNVYPEGFRDEYHSIIYLEPIDERNKLAIGYDMFSEQVRRAAMEKARDEGITTMSGKVKLVQEITQDVQAGFLMYVPIYRNGEQHQTVEQRRNSLEGFVYAPFRMNDLMNGILGNSVTEITFQIYDSKKSDKNLMYDHNTFLGITEGDYNSSGDISSIEFGGEKWIIEFHELNMTSLIYEKTISLIFLGVGLVLCTLLFFVIRSFINTKDHIRNLSLITKEISNKNLKNHMPTNLLNMNDEIGDLAREFENMKSHVNKSMQLERELTISEINLRNQRMSTIGELSAKLAHDLRNPLTVIKNSIELIEMMQKDKLNEDTEEYLQLIKRAIFRMKHQLEDVMAYVKNRPLDIISVMTDDIINSVLKTTPIPSHIEVILPENNILIQCDQKQMVVALSNIITNSVQVLEKKDGKITIKVSENEDGVSIFVEDTGSGITSENMSKIFEPLFTTKQEGTGLGLVSCKNIVENHGGTISVKNNPTTFEVKIPKKTVQEMVNTTSH